MSGSRKTISLVVTSGLIIGLLVIYAVYISLVSASLSLDIAPSSGSISLDGKTVSPGKHRVHSGAHRVVFSRTGFSSITRDVNLKRGVNQFVGAALAPKDPNYADWYNTHPDDQKKAESIASKSFDSTSNQTLKDMPILKRLPYINIEPYFKIDYGVSLKYPDNPAKSALYIYANSSDAKSAALKWLQDNGADPAKLEIIYP